MTPLSYLIKVFVCSGILLGYYWLFLRNKKFHHYNRFYLLGTLLLSVLLPFINIPVFDQPDNQLSHVVYRTADVITVNALAAKAAGPHRYDLFGWFLSAKNDLYLLYTGVIALILFTLVRTFLYIRRISRKYPYEVINNLKFYNTSEPGTPFSFFRSIFWNRELTLDSENGQQIFRHELFHVQQRHTVDSVLAEIVTACFWYNPLFHIIKKELKAIHEFLADQYAASGNDRYAYAELLVQQTIRSGRLSISNYFFQNHIKRRIAMITQLKKGRYNYWSRLMPLPIAILLFCSIALYAKPKLNIPHHGMAAVSNNPLASDTTPRREKKLRSQQDDELDNVKGEVEDQADLKLKLNADLHQQADKEKLRDYINSLTTKQLREMLQEEMEKHINQELDEQYKKTLRDYKTSGENNDVLKKEFLDQEQALLNARSLQDINESDVNQNVIRLKLKQLSDLREQKAGEDAYLEKALEQQKYLMDQSAKPNDLIKLKALQEDQMRNYVDGQQLKMSQDQLSKLKSTNDYLDLAKTNRDQLMLAETRASDDNRALLNKLNQSGDNMKRDMLLSKQSQIKELEQRIMQLEARMQELQEQLEKNKKAE